MIELQILTGTIAVAALLVALSKSRPHITTITPPPPGPTRSAKETLEDLKYQEELKKNYKYTTTWLYLGEEIENPTDEQLADPRLVRNSRWVKLEKEPTND